MSEALTDAVLASGRFAVFGRLTPASARVARLFARLGFTAVYIDVAPAMRRTEVLSDLARSGVRQVDYAALPEYDAYAYFRIIATMTRPVFENLFPQRAIAGAAELFPPVGKREHKVGVLLYDTIAGLLVPEAQLYALADYLRGRGCRCFAWPSARFVALALLGHHRKWAEQSVAAVLCAVEAATKILRKFTANRGASAPAAAAAPEKNALQDTARVILFAHKGPYYAKLFEKNQYYSADPESPLHRRRVLHVELADMLPGRLFDSVMSDYREAGLDVAILSVPAGSGGIRQWWDAIAAGRRLGLSALAALMVEVARSRVERGRGALSRFSNAKLALLGYEHLFPLWLTYALQANGIRVAASQERLLQCQLPGWAIILDDYFVQGTASRESLAANPLAVVEGVHEVGDVRLSEMLRPVPRHAGFPKGFDHATLVLDWHSDPDPVVNAQATTSNWANNSLFYRDIVELARRFPKSCFILRGKNADWLEIPAFAGIRADVERLPNIVVSTDYTRPLISNDLAIAADSVIARYTSLGDQCMTIGKPVIYHDGALNKGKLVSSVLDFAPYKVMAYNFGELAAAYARVVETGHALPEAERAAMVGHYFGAPSESRWARDKMLQKLESLLGYSKAIANADGRTGAAVVSSLAS